jgi:hypothetical protein
LADALSRVVDEKKVCLKEEFLDVLRKKSLVEYVITHERFEGIGDEFSLERATWKYRQYVQLLP